MFCHIKETNTTKHKVVQIYWQLWKNGGEGPMSTLLFSSSCQLNAHVLLEISIVPIDGFLFLKFKSGQIAYISLF
jgi:hypothetical protein